MRANKQTFIKTHEWVVPVGLFLLFLTLTLPGISWGAPSIWHPDEIVVRSINAVFDGYQFSEINFDYPDLPQYAMFFLGKIMVALGYGDNILVASRILSASLAGLVVVLTYSIARQMGGNIFTAALSGLILTSVSEMSHNGRFAHNDTYVTFFVALSILFLLHYKNSDQRGWLYASLFTVGMAASSKYNGISLAMAPAVVFLIAQKHKLKEQPLRVLETILISSGLTFLGFAFGTPKALFWMTYYFKRMFPALLHTGNYLRQPDSVRGIVGQYAVMAKGIGIPLFLLFLAATIWVCYTLFQVHVKRTQQHHAQASAFVVLLLSLIALDIPITISYNYPIRFFLPMMPIMAVFSAFFIEAIYQHTKYRTVTIVVITLTLLYSQARNVSVMLLFMNDSRIAASEFLQTLPMNTSLEHTYYPPTIPSEHFEREHNYPIYFRKAQDEPLPTSKKFTFNAGESELYARKTDYFIVDSFTVDKFNSPYTCADMQLECDFFNQLKSGRSEHYRLLEKFEYTLPRWLPQIKVDFVNPSIYIYERIP